MGKFVLFLHFKIARKCESCLPPSDASIEAFVLHRFSQELRQLYHRADMVYSQAGTNLIIIVDSEH
jgi:hypothetical protein